MLLQNTIKAQLGFRESWEIVDAVRGKRKETSISAGTARFVLFWKKTWGAKTFSRESKYELNVHNDAQKVYYFLTTLLNENA